MPNGQTNPFPWGTVGGVASGLLGQLGRRNRERRQHNYNMQIANNNFDKQRQMWQHAWDTETAYNDPSAQMSRYKNAGINPHLAYMTGGGQNTATTGALPQYKQDTQQLPESLGESFKGIMQQYIQNRTVATALRKENAKADQEEIRAQLMASGLKAKKSFEDYKSQYQRNKAKQDIEFQFGHPKEGLSFDDGTKFTRYQQGLQEDFELKQTQKLMGKSQEYLNTITASNLITNDQLIEMQTQIQKAQFDFLKSDWFKTLPPYIKAVFMALAGKIGAR